MTASAHSSARSIFSTLRLIVTSGPTREWLDPVRFLTNSSSGKTGWEVARAALGRFREVIYIAGPCDEKYRRVNGAQNIEVTTTEEMGRTVLSALQEHSLLIMAAAPADFTPLHPENQKIKKQPGEITRTIELTPTMDILRTAGENPPADCYLVGFAAETTDVETHAREKLLRKKAHFICANEVFRDSKGFGDIPNTLSVFDRFGGQRTIGPLPKADLAVALLDYLELRLRVIAGETPDPAGEK